MGKVGREAAREGRAVAGLGGVGRRLRGCLELPPPFFELRQTEGGACGATFKLGIATP